MTILKARIEIAMPLAALAACDLDWPTLSHNPPTISLFEGDDSTTSMVEIFAPGPLDEAALAAFMAALAAIAGHAIPAPVFQPVIDKDWVSESQRLRQPVDAGRFTICEAHQREDISPAREVIVIEAGQAFGTGGHESTKGCLMALDALADQIAESLSPSNALDLGTGSGVLAIAMARLWQIPIMASDIDPVATDTAATNIAANEAAGITTITADGASDPAIAAAAPFDLITANILSGPLIEMAADIAGISADGAALVLSGITREQAMAVQTAYVEAGFTAMSRIMLGDWCTMIFTRQT
jgi:ribosomal protein L11 methyltransferase